MKKIILLIILFFQFLSCSKNESDIIESRIDFDGFYKIESIISSEMVDLNNDNIYSMNLMEEIPNYFGNVSYDLELKKLEKTNPYKLLLRVYLPVPNEYIDKPFGSVYYNRYAYFKRINPYQNEILINQTSEIDNSVSLEKLVILENNRVESKITQLFYDFKTSSWKSLNIEIIYSKIN